MVSWRLFAVLGKNVLADALHMEQKRQLVGSHVGNGGNVKLWYHQQVHASTWVLRSKRYYLQNTVHTHKNTSSTEHTRTYTHVYAYTHAHAFQIATFRVLCVRRICMYIYIYINRLTRTSMEIPSCLRTRGAAHAPCAHIDRKYSQPCASPCFDFP